MINFTFSNWYGPYDSNSNSRLYFVEKAMLSISDSDSVIRKVNTIKQVNFVYQLRIDTFEIQRHSFT